MAAHRAPATRRHLAARTRVSATAFALASAWLLLHAPLAGAAAGGGSSGFGGGGGGGGGGFGGGSSSLDDSGSATGGGIIESVAIFGFVLLIFIVVGAVLAIPRIRHRRRRRDHQRRVELAAAAAAGDDEAFAPDAVRAAAERIFRAAQAAWDQRDEERLAQLLVPELHDEWRRRLAGFRRKGWHNRVDVLKIREIRYLGLSNRDGHGEDRVTVRIRARVRDYVVQRDGSTVKRSGDESLKVTLTEYWTLARRTDGDGWIVASIESDDEGRHVLDREIVATPWEDEARMRDASLLEVAALDKLPDGVSTAEVAVLDYAGDARTAALDLSLVDGRWAPDVLEASVRRTVAAWAEAVDGADADLLDVAAPDAARELLHPRDPTSSTRLVIRGPQVRHLTIAALDPAGSPPTMSVEVQVTGRRYLEDRESAAVLSGSKEHAVTSTERWTLALTGPDDRPWQVVAVGSGDVDHTTR